MLESVKLESVKFHSKTAALSLPISEKAALVSVCTPGLPVDFRPKWPPQSFLRLEFHDTDDENEEPWICFDRQMARNFIDFVERIAQEKQILHIHCTAGVSRSAALARFVAEKYGLEFPERYVMDNKLVGRVLRREEHGEWTPFLSGFKKARQ